MRNLIFALIVGLLVLIFLPRDTKDALFGSWTIFSQQDNVGTIKITGTIAHSFFDHEMIPVILCGNNGQKSWIPCKPSIYKSAVEANSLVEKGWVVEVVIAAKPRFWSLFGNQELWITEFHQVSLPSQLKNPLPQRINHGGGFRKVYRGGSSSRSSCKSSVPANVNIYMPPTPPVTPQNIIHIKNDGDGNIYNITIGGDRKTTSGNTLSEPSRPTNNKDTLHSGIPTVSF